MKKSITLIEINKLKSHETVEQKRLAKLIRRIKKGGHLKNPIVVDRTSFVVLDGHHRIAVLKLLGCKKIPAFLVDYKSKDVRVYLRKKGLIMKIIKEMVIEKGKDGRPFPPKTTRHLLKYRPRGINMDLKKLK